MFIKYKARLALLCICALTTSTSAFADLIVENAWARATPPGSPMGAVYGKLVNTGSEPIKITVVETGVAKLAEFHQTVEVDGMMRMREVAPMIVPAEGVVVLEPGSKHIMLMGLRGALEEGKSFEIHLEDDKGHGIQAMVVVGGFGQMEQPR